MDNSFFKKNFDLSACSGGSNFRMALIHRLFYRILGRRPLQAGMHVPRWRDFVVVFWVHHGFPLFQLAHNARSLLARLRG